MNPTKFKFKVRFQFRFQFRSTMVIAMVIARYMLSLAALMRMASGGLLAQQGPTASRMLTEANQKYNQYSYSSALERYEKLMKANAVPADQRDLVGYRMVVCLRAMQRWDQALSTGTAFVQNHRGSIWEARGIVEMAQTLCRRG